VVIDKITLKNFYRYGNNETVFDISGTGITAITGSNGNGKSTLLIDSLLFALYGQCRCESIDNVVNRYTGKDCKVGVEFTQDGVKYKVLRYRKHTTHKNNVYLFKEDDDISGHTTSETNTKIVDLIKMNYIAFTNSCVFSSELYSAFLEKRESDRLVVFENILSLKEITLFYTEIKKILKELDEKLTEKKISKSAIVSEISTIENTISTYSANAKQKLLSMKSEKEEAKKMIEEAKKKIEELSIIDISKEKEKLLNNTLKDEYINKLNSLKKELLSLIVNDDEEALRIVDKYNGINFEENRLKEIKYKEDLETLNIRENGYKLAMEQINSLTKELSFIEKELESNNSKMLESDKRLEKLNQAICPFCCQHLDNEKMMEEKNKEEKNISDLKDRNEEINEKIAEINKTLEEQRDSYKWLLADYNTIKEKLDKNFVPNSDLIEEQYKNAVKKVEDIKKKKIENESKTNEINIQIEDYSNKINHLEVTNYTEEELNNISAKIDYFKNIISENELTIASIDGSAKNVFDKKYIDGLKEQVESKKKEDEDINNEINLINDDIKHYSYLGECFSNKAGGFKKYFIGEMIDLFNERVNQYLPFFFTEDVKISFDKNLTDTITMDGFDVSFSSFSQGQRQRAELAIDFALFDVARVFFSNDNKLLLLDEVDKGLDKFGIKSMLDLLNGFDKQMKIFIVSHNPLLADEVDDKIKIGRDENGFSVISK